MSHDYFAFEFRLWPKLSLDIRPKVRLWPYTCLWFRPQFRQWPKLAKSVLVGLCMWCFVYLFLVVSIGAINCLERLVSEMTYYVSSVTLNPTHSLTYISGYSTSMNISTPLLLSIVYSDLISCSQSLVVY